MYSSTHTEKQVEVLQADNDRLRQELTDTRNAQTKAATVSKPNSHRQQQLEEEVKRLKAKIMEQEVTISSNADKYAQLEGLVKSLKTENMQCDGKIRDLQAELVSLYAKSPEVVKVTKVKQVESESLKQQFRDSQEEITQLKQTIERQKEDLHNSQIEVKYLQKILKKTETEKEESEASLWKDIEKLVTEHQLTLARIELEKQQVVHELQEELRKESTVNRELALQGLEESLQARFHRETSQLMEDLTIAKQAAITKLREELNREREKCLQQQREKIESEHRLDLEKLEERLNAKTEEAILSIKLEEQEKRRDFETKYQQIVHRLQALSPVLAEFVESYILLQREVTNFPKLIKQTVSEVKKEMTAAISGISEYNKDLVQKYQREMKLRKKYHNELVELKGGDSKTLMITQIAPVRKNEGETICSLNFAQRVRNVELGAATRRLENGDMGEMPGGGYGSPMAKKGLEFHNMTSPSFKQCVDIDSDSDCGSVVSSSSHCNKSELKKRPSLPKEAVAMMLEWLRQHKDNPYPNDDEKAMLIKQTGLTITQINYWFNNARRRILPKWAQQCK